MTLSFKNETTIKTMGERKGEGSYVVKHFSSLGQFEKNTSFKTVYLQNRDDLLYQHAKELCPDHFP